MQLHGLLYLFLLYRKRNIDLLVTRFARTRNSIVKKCEELKLWRLRRKQRTRWVNDGKTDQWWRNMFSGLSPEEDWKKTEHFKGIASTCHASVIADHVTSTGHNSKWDPFEILAKGRSDTHCKIKETANSGTQTYPKRYCQQRKALSVLLCIF